MYNGYLSDKALRWLIHIGSGSGGRLLDPPTRCSSQWAQWALREHRGFWDSCGMDMMANYISPHCFRSICLIRDWTWTNQLKLGLRQRNWDFSNRVEKVGLITNKLIDDHLDGLYVPYRHVSDWCNYPEMKYNEMIQPSLLDPLFYNNLSPVLVASHHRAFSEFGNSGRASPPVGPRDSNWGRLS